MRANFCLAVSALVLASGTAFAADLPVRSAPPVFVPPIPAFTWSGVYVGATAGVVNQDAHPITSIAPGTHIVLPPNLAAITAAGSAGSDRPGFTGGGTVGYNYQVGSVVFGVEADAAYTGPGGGIAQSGNLRIGGGGTRNFSINSTDRADFLATGRGRLGYAVDRALFYATGGVALTDQRLGQVYSDTLFNGAGQTSTTRLRAGFAVGGGIEYAFSPNWSVKGEYLFSRFDGGGASYAITSTTGGSNLVNLRNNHLDLQVGRVGLNYRFNTIAPPVVARY